MLVTAAEVSSTSPKDTDGPLAHGDAVAINLLSATLQAANYTEEGIRGALSASSEGVSLRTAEIPVYERRLSEGGTLASMIRLFALGLTVDMEEARACLEPLEPERLQAMGLLHLTESGARSPVRLVAHDGLVLACDPGPTVRGELAQDYVIGVNPTSRALASLTVRRPVHSFLDLGTGCGVQALLGARHSGSVVAVDINPRAINFAAFNAALNKMPQIECRLGSLFEPVEGERFDIIACNPPYVVSPDNEFVYRDSGMPADAICREIVLEAPAHLTEGGFAHVLCSWAHYGDESWDTPLKAWVADSGCDAWLLHYNTSDPLTYAYDWNQYLKIADPEAYTDILDRWTAYYRESGITSLSTGTIILRRRSDGDNWVRADDLPSGHVDSCGEHILRVFGAQDYLVGLSEPRQMLDETFRLVEGHRLEQSFSYRQGGYAPEEAVVRLEKGLRYKCTVDNYGTRLLSGFDGQRPLAAVIEAVARESGLDGEVFQAGALSVVRRLIELGFLERSDPISGVRQGGSI